MRNGRFSYAKKVVTGWIMATEVKAVVRWLDYGLVICVDSLWFFDYYPVGEYLPYNKLR